MTPASASSLDPANALWASLEKGLCGKMNMNLDALAAEYGNISMPIEGNTQHLGMLHGGASIALAETIVSLCAVVHAQKLYGEGATAVGTTYSATHHKSARSGVVHARATAQHLGHTVCSYVVEVRHEDGTLLCTVLGNAHLLPPKQEEIA